MSRLSRSWPLLLSVLLAGCSASHRVSAGKPAPEIDAADLDGKPMKLSDFRGKVVMLDFWGDW
jgi:hypothetical protein